LHHDSHAAPNEIRALTDNFMRMGDDIVREEAGVENALRQKNILLKEVHHRVKNNLQMISSIMNMQMRQASSPETKSVLGRLQDRILSLALIHRDLHQSDTFGLVNVGTLITELVENAVDVVMPEGRGIDVTTDIDGLMVVTDQAVPLSLIAAEAITNAIKYTGATDDQTPWLKISLHREEDEGVFALSNSFHPGSAAGTTPERDSTGLGGTLINAFVTQLGGDVDITKNDTAYAMTIRFSVNDIVNDAPDY